MSAWHELVERDHDLQNPTSVEKIRLAGFYMRLGPQTAVLDVACGKAGPALVLAQEFGCRVHGVDVSAVFIEAARRRIADAGFEKLISLEIRDAAQVSELPSCDAALCLGAAFIWGHTGDAAAALAQTVGGGGAVAVGEPFWREAGRDEQGFVDLPQTVARFEAADIDLTGMVAASEDDWDRYKSLQWRAAVETGSDEVMESHLSRRESYLSARRAELGWAIFTGRVRGGHWPARVFAKTLRRSPATAVRFSKATGRDEAVVPRVPVLLITGPVGVGKTATADAVSDLLAQRGVRNACVDLPQIGKAFPVDDADPWKELSHRNLACMWANFNAAGAERLVISRVLETRSGLRRIAGAVPGAEITVVRLRAPLPTLHRRIRARDSRPEWFLHAATELSHSMELNTLEDFLVDNEHMSVDETARAVLQVICEQ